MKALSEGIFQQFFTKQEEEIQMAVNDLYEQIFKEAFDKNEGRLNKETFEEIVDEKLQDDEHLREILIEEFAKIQLGEDEKAS